MVACSTAEQDLPQAAATISPPVASSISADPAAIRIGSRAELEAKYGELITQLADEYPTAYRLCAALKKRSPAVLVSDGFAKAWFKYNQASYGPGTWRPQQQRYV